MATNPTGTAATAAAPAPAAAAAAVPTPALDPAKDILFPDNEPPKKAGEPEKKKRRLQLKCDHDPYLKRILQAVVGTRAHKFTDGLLKDETIEAMRELFLKLDFVQDGVLKQIHFQSVRGIDPIWEDLLEACDVDGDGSIRPTEFVAGFVELALEKPVTNEMPLGAQVTGLDILKSAGEMINAHVMMELQFVKQKMGWE